ncbi:MAG: bifunctional serine/threonine-protein kinase/formylglycine-generating enzyme family protein [Archangium sp.]
MFAGFRIERLLAEGASARVYLARDPTLDRDVALKVFKPVSDSTQFLREAQLTARLDHQHIVRVLHCGTEDGSPFLVLEYVPGPTLAEVIAKGSLDPQLPARAATEIAEGLRYLHAQGVVHGDLKAENVLMPTSGRLRLVDFGLSAAIGQRADGRGTEDTLSPQCWLARHQLTPADDIWALGVLLTQLVTGKPPFAAGEVSRAAFSNVALEPPRVGGPLEPLIARCLSWEPAQRPSADDVLAALRQLELEAHPPFRGLAPFSERDRDDFQGRDAETQRGLELLSHREPLAIAGPSGVGKSSFAHARLVPRLRESSAGELTVLSFRPGAQPLRTLALALGDAALEAQLAAEPTKLGPLLRGAQRSRKGPLLVLVDQFEEVFTLATSADADAFCRALAAAGSEFVKLLVLVRDEFLGRLFQSPLASTDLRVLSLRPLDAGELERAISEPLRRCRAQLDPPSLARRIADDVARQPAPLPLLQFSCHALWERRGAGNTLSGSEYDRLGTAAGILAAHAQDFSSALDVESRTHVRRLLLTAVNADGTRRPVPRATLPDQSLVDRLIERRLLVARDDAGVPIVELAHESLATLWPELQRWLRESTDAHRLQSDLETAGERWERLGRRDADTWRESVQLTRERLGDLPLSPRAERFVAASELLGQSAARRRRTFFAAALLAAFLISGGAVALALRFRDNERRALEQQAELLEIAENLGAVKLEFAPLDWDGEKFTPASLDGLARSWRLWPADPSDPHRPRLERPLAIRDLTLSGTGVVTASFLAPGGPAFLEVYERGGECPSSWIRLNALPGLVERRSGQVLQARIQVPTCRASAADEVALRPGLWLDRHEERNALYAPFEAMQSVHHYDHVQPPANADLSSALLPEYPVTGVDWFTAAAFCRWQGKRLPLMDEWRAADVESSGTPNLDGTGDGFGALAPVDAALDVTPLGIRSLRGNVREWTASLRADGTQRMALIGGGDWVMSHELEAKFRSDENFNARQGIDFALGVRCARRSSTEW